ncbi:MAG: ribosomal-processing cysteine protease Prp [Bacilli bacterium]
MIKVLRSKKNISITGHAMYDDFGKDIVCSAVSSIVITSLNGILSINPSALIYNNSKDGLEIEIKSFDDITLKLIDNMMELLIKLSNDYPKNIQVKEGA